MRIYILSLLVSFTFLNAGLINAIAIIVNNSPITLYDIDQTMRAKNIKQQKAVESLIDKILYNQDLKKQRISVDIFDIDNYIGKLAQQNNMNILDFKSLVRQQQDYKLFKEQIKKQLIHQKLIKKIATGKLIIASDKDMKIFYENNHEQFKIPDTIEVIAYVSKDKKILNQLKANPMLQSDKFVMQHIAFKQNELSPQSKYILNNTKIKQFSSIFAENKNYNMFYVKEKKDIKVLTFKEVKNKIFQNIMKKREQRYLNEYFETMKITADIKVLR